MAHTKRRVRQHIMEDQSYLIFKGLLPEEWAIHEYRPDYGIDLVVELFKFSDESRDTADTLGELFFVQLKSVKRARIRKLAVAARKNPEKIDASYDANKTREIEVVPFVIDTDELLTIQTMGPTIPVVLCVACIDSKRAYFVCLNDIVEKVLLVDDPNYTENATKTIYLPVKNEITKDGLALNGLRFMAKRAKFYAAFNRFNYQQNEIWHYLGLEKPGITTYRNKVEPAHDLESELRPLLRRFITVLKNLDIWVDNPAWELVGYYHRELLKMETMINNSSIKTDQIISQMLLLWHGLTALSSTYEEICREWYLPTYLGDLLS